MSETLHSEKVRGSEKKLRRDNEKNKVMRGGGGNNEGQGFLGSGRMESEGEKNKEKIKVK